MEEDSIKTMFEKSELFLIKEILNRVLLNSYGYDIGVKSEFKATFTHDEVQMLRDIEEKIK